MCGVNPEVAHEHMAGLNFVHQVAAAMEQKKLFHIDLNDQEFGRYDQDFRFGQANLKHAFFLVKLLEDYKYNGPRSFDAHAFRQSDYDRREGVRQGVHADVHDPEGKGRRGTPTRRSRACSR
jgi:xylose isomerase